MTFGRPRVAGYSQRRYDCRRLPQVGQRRVAPARLSKERDQFRWRRHHRHEKARRQVPGAGRRCGLSNGCRVHRLVGLVLQPCPRRTWGVARQRPV